MEKYLKVTKVSSTLYLLSFLQWGTVICENWEIPGTSVDMLCSERLIDADVFDDNDE